MKSKLLSLGCIGALTAPAFLAAASISAQAETLHVTWVEPAEPSQNESWDQSSNPTPCCFTNPGSETDVPVTNGNPSGLSVVFFFAAGGGGGFQDNHNLVNAFGDQVYSGPESSPVFAPGSFTLGDSNTFNVGTLTFTAVPEPSTWTMMLLGFAGIGFAGYRRARARRATLSA
jgi:hypothetical protein